MVVAYGRADFVFDGVQTSVTFQLGRVVHTSPVALVLDGFFLDIIITAVGQLQLTLLALPVGHPFPSTLNNCCSLFTHFWFFI